MLFVQNFMTVGQFHISLAFTGQSFIKCLNGASTGETKVTKIRSERQIPK